MEKPSALRPFHLAIDISSATPQPTGIGTYVHEVVRRLVQLDGDHRISLLFHSLRQPPPVWAREAVGPRVELIHRRIPGPALLESWRLLGRPLIETFVSRSRFGPLDLFFSPATFIPPQKMGIAATTVHDLTFLNPAPPTSAPTLKQRMAHRFGPSYLNWAFHHRVPRLNRILCVSNSSRRTLEAALEFQPRSVPPPTITVTPLGVDPRFQACCPTAPSRPYFFHIGGPHPRKDIPTLLQAFQDLLSQPLPEPPCLLLAGFPALPDRRPSPFSSPLQSLSDLSALPPDLAQRFPLAAAHSATLGYVDQAALNLLYSGALALVFPSLEEGFGLPVLEALACGCPVITTTTVAVVEHLPSGTVATVPPSSPQALTDVLAELVYGRPITSDQARMVGPTISQQFSWERTAQSTLAALTTSGG